MMANKAEQTAVLTEQSPQRATTVLELDSLVTGYREQSVDFYVQRLIDVHYAVQEAMRKDPAYMPLEAMRRKREFEYIEKKRVGIDRLKEDFIALHPLSVITKDKAKQTKYKTATLKRLDLIEKLVNNRLDSLVSSAQNAWDQRDSTEYSAAIEVLQQLGYVAPELPIELIDISVNPEPREFKLQRPNLVKTAAGIGLSAVLLTTVASPAAAEESTPTTSSNSQTVSQVVETTQQESPEPQAPVDTSAPSSEQPEEKTETENTEEPQQVAEYTNVKALPTTMTVEDALQRLNAKQDTLPQTVPTMKSVAASLTELVSEPIKDQNEFLQSKNLAGVGEDTIFNMKDPVHPDQKLSIEVSPEQFKELQTLIKKLNSVVVNDEDVIRAVLEDYAADQDYDELTLLLAEKLPTLDFVEGSNDFTAAQKIAYLRLSATIHSIQYEIAEQQYEQAQRAAAALHRAAIRNNDGAKKGKHEKPITYDTNWDGKEVSAQRIERVVRTWPIPKKAIPTMVDLVIAANKNADKHGFNPAAAIAQALVESGWMKSDLAVEHNNFFGMKDGSDWDGPVVSLGTHEVYDGRTRVVTKSRFRSFKTAEQGLINYASKFIQKTPYDDARRHHLSPELFLSGLVGGVNASGEITKPQGATLGYATDPDYVYTMLSIIAQYNIDKIVPSHFLQGYQWDRKSNDNNVMPSSIRGKVYFNQHDKARANKPYRHKNSPRNYTFETSSCMPHSEAIVISELIGKVVSPDKTVRFNLENGYRTVDSGTSDASVPAIMKKYGLKARNIRLTAAAFKKAIDAGGMIIVSGRDTDRDTPGTSSGHIYVVDDYAESNGKARFYVLDPNNSRLSLRNYRFSDLRHDPKTGARSMRTAWVITKD